MEKGIKLGELQDLKSRFSKKQTKSASCSGLGIKHNIQINKIHSKKNEEKSKKKRLSKSKESELKKIKDVLNNSKNLMQWNKMKRNNLVSKKSLQENSAEKTIQTAKTLNSAKTKNNTIEIDRNIRRPFGKPQITLLNGKREDDQPYQIENHKNNVFALNK